MPACCGSGGLFPPLLVPLTCPTSSGYATHTCLCIALLGSQLRAPPPSPTSCSTSPLPLGAALPGVEHVSAHAVAAGLQPHLFCSILLVPGSALPGLGTFIRMRPWKLPRSVCRHRPQEGSSTSTV